MLSIRSNDSLYGRIVTRYFGFGLICIGLLLAVSVAENLFPGDRPAWLMMVATTLPLAVLWYGSIQLRRLLTAPEQILTQLADIPN